MDTTENQVLVKAINKHCPYIVLRYLDNVYTIERATKYILNHPVASHPLQDYGLNEVKLRHVLLTIKLQHLVES